LPDCPGAAALESGFTDRFLRKTETVFCLRAVLRRLGAVGSGFAVHARMPILPAATAATAGEKDQRHLHQRAGE